jgi:hypothetical protein
MASMRKKPISIAFPGIGLFVVTSFHRLNSLSLENLVYNRFQELGIRGGQVLILEFLMHLVTQISGIW